MRILVFFLLLCTAGYSQNKQQTEWDRLDQAFVAVFKALEAGDKSAFTALSLPEVDCMSCRVSGEINEDTYFIPASLFYENLSKGFKESQLYKSLVSRGYSFRTLVLKKPAGDLKIYEVWVDTYLANEWAEGHEGLSHVFQFVKKGNTFKLYGLVTRP